jgi:Cytochrome C oxidase subunit II, periplasmic domain
MTRALVDFINDDNENIEFNCYMIREDDLENSIFSMLEVDYRLIEYTLSIIFAEVEVI